MLKVRIFALLLALFALGAHAKEFTQRPQGYVNDLNNRLTKDEAARLEQKLSDLQRTMRVTMLVVTISSAADYGHPSGLIELGDTLMNNWKPGTKGVDQGLLVVIANNDPPYKVNIRTGYGVEGVLPDLKAQQIIDKMIKPSINKGGAGSFAAGIDAGITGVAQAAKELHEEYLRKQAANAATPAPADKSDLEGAIIFFAIGGGAILVFIIIFSVVMARREERLRKEEAARLAENSERAARERMSTFRGRDPYGSATRRTVNPAHRPARSTSDSGVEQAVGLAVVAAALSPAPSPAQKTKTTDADSPAPAPYESPSSGGMGGGGGAGDN